MTFRKSYTFQSQLKNRTLFYYLLKSLEILTYISSFIQNNLWLIRIEISFMGKYKFSISKSSIQICIFNCNKFILVILWVQVLASQRWNYKLQYKHYNGKNKQGRREGRIWNFQGYWRNSTSIFQGLIKNNVGFSGHHQEKFMWNFQGSWF